MASFQVVEVDSLNLGNLVVAFIHEVDNLNLGNLEGDSLDLDILMEDNLDLGDNHVVGSLNWDAL